MRANALPSYDPAFVFGGVEDEGQYCSRGLRRCRGNRRNPERDEYTALVGKEGGFACPAEDWIDAIGCRFGGAPLKDSGRSGCSTGHEQELRPACSMKSARYRPSLNRRPRFMLGAQAASPSAPPRQRAFVVFRRPNAAHRACGSRVNPAGHPLGTSGQDGVQCRWIKIRGPLAKATTS